MKFKVYRTSCMPVDENSVDHRRIVELRSNHELKRANKDEYYKLSVKYMDTKEDIEISSLEELMQFVDKYGECIIWGRTKDGCVELEIYDRCRE